MFAENEVAASRYLKIEMVDAVGNKVAASRALKIEMVDAFGNEVCSSMKRMVCVA